jgi:hypothetical protein
MIHKHTQHTSRRHSKPIIHNIPLEGGDLSQLTHTLTQIPLDQAQCTHTLIPLKGGNHAQPIIHNILLEEGTINSARIHTYTHTTRGGGHSKPIIHNIPLKGGDHAQRTNTHMHSYHSTMHSALICPYLSKEATMHSPSYTTYFLRR